MQTAAKGITQWLTRHGAIRQEDHSLYEYAIYSLMLTIAPLFIVMIIGCLMGLVLESVIFILPFMVVRKYSGGFHMKHAWTCLICSCTVLFLSIYVTEGIECSNVLSIVTLGAVVSLGICSPIDSNNRQLTLVERSKYKRVTIMIVMCFFVIYGLLLMIRCDGYAKWIAVGLILPAVLQMPAAVKKLADRYRGRD